MKNFLLGIALFFCFDLLDETGWSPPLIVFPATSTTPYIATDLSGNCVAIWYDNSAEPDNGVLLGATLATGALNDQGQPQWIQTSSVATNISFPNRPNSQGVPLAIAPNGDAFVTWSDQSNNIWVSSLPLGQQIWSTPVAINNQGANSVGNPTLAIAANGNIVVIWTNQNQLLSNSFISSAGVWQGQSAPVNLKNGSNLNQVVVDNLGNAIAVLGESEDDSYAFTFDFSKNSWQAVAPLATGPNSVSTIGVDQDGNGTLISVSSDGTVSVAYLPFGSPAFINQQTLSIAGQNSSSFPSIQIDQIGNALAVWTETSGNIASARYAANSGVWNLFPQLSLLGSNPSNLSLAMDSLGNALLSWTVTSGGVQVAALASNHVNWQMVSNISLGKNNQRNQQAAITTLGDAIAIWENDINNTIGNIESSVFTGLFAAPQNIAPLNYKGQVLQNRVLSKTDSIHRLTWDSNPNPAIKSYILLRNGAVLSILDASYLTYVFDDYGRSGDADNYTLFSLTSTNVTSVPLTVILP